MNTQHSRFYIMLATRKRISLNVNMFFPFPDFKM